MSRYRFQLIGRGSRIGVRIKDPEARARKEFKGIPMYPASERWRIVARWEPADPPAEIAVPNVLGEVERSPSPGTAVFTVDGKEYRLTPVLEEGSPDLLLRLRRRDQPHRDLRGGALPLRRSGEGRHGRPRLQPGLQPALRVQRLRDLPAAAEAEPARAPRRGRGEAHQPLTPGPVSRWTPNAG